MSIDRGQSAIIFVLVMIIVVLVSYLVFPVVVDEQAMRMQAAAMEQAETACNEQLPGDGWELAEFSLPETGVEGFQTIACTRNGTVREIRVHIEVELKS